MKNIKKQNTRSLLNGLTQFEETRKGIKGQNLNGIKSLYDEFLKTDSKPRREKLINEFTKRNQEFAEFMSSDPELIQNEIQKSLLIAAAGGEYTEEEISFDSHGHKKVRYIKKTVPPDVNAARALREILGSGGSEESEILKAWLDSVTGDADEK